MNQTRSRTDNVIKSGAWSVLIEKVKRKGRNR